MDNTEKLHSITVGFPEVQVFVKKSKKAKYAKVGSEISNIFSENIDLINLKERL